MTPEQLAEIKARADKATPGPWGRDEVLYIRTGDFGVIAHCDWAAQTDEEWIQQEQDADFIAGAREDVPALIAEVERLKAARLDESKVCELISAYRDSNLTDRGLTDLIMSLYDQAAD